MSQIRAIETVYKGYRRAGSRGGAMPVLTFGSLFAGIGGFDLGFERAGMKCVWQVEIDPFCQRVLAKHWPDVRRHDDVRTFPPAGDWYADVICGGFPCQDISVAGKRAGIDGERSGLWRDYARVIRLLRPRYVVVENVPALLVRGINRVLKDLAESGYDAEWDCLPASAFGAPHQRDRVFLVAYPRGGWGSDDGLRPRRASSRRRGAAAASHAKRRGLQGRIFGPRNAGAIQPPAHCRTSLGTIVGETWQAEPGESWLDDGLSGRMAEVFSRLLGNAVVPQIAEWIGRRLMESAHADA